MALFAENRIKMDTSIFASYLMRLLRQSWQNKNKEAA